VSIKICEYFLFALGNVAPLAWKVRCIARINSPLRARQRWSPADSRPSQCAEGPAVSPVSPNAASARSATTCPCSWTKCPASGSSSGADSRGSSSRAPPSPVAQHRILHADRHERLAVPAFAEELRGLERYIHALHVGRDRHQRGKPAHACPVATVRERCIVSGRLGVGDSCTDRFIMPAISKSGFAATNAFQASKPGPGERPTPMPVFMTMSRSMRPGYSIGSVSPSSPPQSCTTSVTRFRSSASMSASACRGGS